MPVVTHAPLLLQPTTIMFLLTFSMFFHTLVYPLTKGCKWIPSLPSRDNNFKALLQSPQRGSIYFNLGNSVA